MPEARHRPCSSRLLCRASMRRTKFCIGRRSSHKLQRRASRSRWRAQWMLRSRDTAPPREWLCAAEQPPSIPRTLPPRASEFPASAETRPLADWPESSRRGRASAARQFAIRQNRSTRFPTRPQSTHRASRCSAAGAVHCGPASRRHIRRRKKPAPRGRPMARFPANARAAPLSHRVKDVDPSQTPAAPAPASPRPALRLPATSAQTHCQSWRNR